MKSQDEPFTMVILKKYVLFDVVCLFFSPTGSIYHV